MSDLPMAGLPLDHVSDRRRGVLSWPVSQSLLAARTSVPPPHAGLIDRPRLYSILDQAIGLPVTTVTAPAGSGKTQLLSSWASRAGVPVAWLTLECADQDPLRFWNAVLTAICRALKPSQESLLSTLRPAPGGGYSASVLPALVADALAELPDRLVLVLDDVHTIAGSSAAEGLTFFMLHLPVRTRLVMSGIYLPEVPRVRLRLEGRLTSIDASTLAFTAQEARALLERAGVKPSTGGVDEIIRRTEGWSAGLRLAALTHADDPVQGEGQWLPSLRAEANEYLLGEVLRHVPDGVRRFLVQTCVCDEICGSLANALTGERDGAVVLRWLADHNVFTLSLGGRGQWYRYHGLFAEALRGGLGSPGLPDEATLCRRAAEWFAAEGHPTAAFDYAVRAGDWDLAQETVLRSWLSMYLDGELHALLAMLDRLPAASFQTGPMARVRDVVSLALGRRPGVAGMMAATSMDTLADVVLAMETGRITGDVDAVRVAVRRLLGEFPPAAHESPVDLRALAFYELGAAEFWTSEREHAAVLLREARSAAHVGGRGYVELGCTSLLAGVLTADDRLTAAVTIAEEGAELARQRGWEQAAASATQWHAMGWVSYLRDQLDDADHYLDLADDAARHNDYAVCATICLIRAVVLSRRGHRPRALQLIEEGISALGKLDAPHVFIDYFDAEAARLLLAVGRVDDCRRILQGEADPTGPIHLSVARAELLMSDGDPRAAWELMTKAAPHGSGYLDQRILGYTLLAILEANEVGTRAGLDVLAEAVQMAEPERMIAPLLQFGARGDRLFKALERRQSAPREFIAEVRSHIASSLSPHKHPALGGLTERETEILIHLDSRATLPEIAATLFVSVNTVKAHLRGLYRKLGVHGRRQAVARAEDLGLL